MKHPMFCGSKKKYRVEGWRYRFSFDTLARKMSGQGKWSLSKKAVIRKVAL